MQPFSCSSSCYITILLLLLTTCFCCACTSVDSLSSEASVNIFKLLPAVFMLFSLGCSPVCSHCVLHGHLKKDFIRVFYSCGLKGLTVPWFICCCFFFFIAHNIFICKCLCYFYGHTEHIPGKAYVETVNRTFIVPPNI